jgi:hypothetical protein
MNPRTRRSCVLGVAKSITIVTAVFGGVAAFGAIGSSCAGDEVLSSRGILMLVAALVSAAVGMVASSARAPSTTCSTSMATRHEVSRRAELERLTARDVAEPARAYKMMARAVSSAASGK